MVFKIPVAHDFICNWCWVGLQQIRRLRQEFDIEIEWRGYEMHPEGYEEPPVTPRVEPENKPSTPTRFQLMLAADDARLPIVIKPRNMKTYNAHQAVEFAKTEGVQDALVERIYEAFWEQGLDINQPLLLAKLAEGIVEDIEGLKSAIKTNRFRDDSVKFDEPDLKHGVFNLPTFFIGDKRLAEQPYSVIRNAVAELQSVEPKPTLYLDIAYDNPHANRPFTFINMVSTIDGKTITGERNEPVGDLGTKTDHLLMHRLERKADAILIGANSLRATGSYWNPETTCRIVVTRSGNVPWESQFLSQGQPIVLTTENAEIQPKPGLTIIRAGKDGVDWHLALKQLKELGIEVVNVLGGSEINAQLLEKELIDELFLTLAPKIKLGAETPTYAGGKPLPRFLVQSYKLVSHLAIGDEVFLRYRK